MLDAINPQSSVMIALGKFSKPLKAKSVIHNNSELFTFTSGQLGSDWAVSQKMFSLEEEVKNYFLSCKFQFLEAESRQYNVPVADSENLI